MSSSDTDEDSEKKFVWPTTEKYSSKTLNINSEAKVTADVFEKISAKKKIKNNGIQEKRKHASSTLMYKFISSTSSAAAEVNKNSTIQHSTMELASIPLLPDYFSFCSNKKTTQQSNPTRSWRDPDFVYERNAPIKNGRSTERYSSRNWIKDDAYIDPKYSFRERDTVGDKRERTGGNSGRCKERNWRTGNLMNATNMSNTDTLVSLGWWSLWCDAELVDSNGQTEIERVWISISQLYDEKPDLFAKLPQRIHRRKGKEEVLCHTPDYSDKLNIAKVANVIRKKIFCFPFPFLYFSREKIAPLYMSTCDGDLYERKGASWKVVNFSE